MEELVASVRSLQWWLSVVVVGIAINLASRGMERPLDRSLSAVSKLWLNWSYRRKRLRVRRLQELERFPARLQALRDEIVWARFRVVVFMLFYLAGLSFFIGRAIVIKVGTFVVVGPPKVGMDPLSQALYWGTMVILVVAVIDWNWSSAKVLLVRQSQHRLRNRPRK